MPWSHGKRNTGDSEYLMARRPRRSRRPMIWLPTMFSLNVRHTMPLYRRALHANAERSRDGCVPADCRHAILSARRRPNGVTVFAGFVEEESKLHECFVQEGEDPDELFVAERRRRPPRPALLDQAVDHILAVRAELAGARVVPRLSLRLQAEHNALHALRADLAAASRRVLQIEPAQGARHALLEARHRDGRGSCAAARIGDDGVGALQLAPPDLADRLGAQHALSRRHSHLRLHASAA
eukprot:3465392-Prymnesium_polylepis.4